MGVTRAPRYDPSVVRTLAAAMGTDPDAHDFVVTDTDTGRVKGVYATEELAIAAVQRLIGIPGLWILTVVHPAHCDCPEAPR